jgi:hypothetical protein
MVMPAGPVRSALDTVEAEPVTGFLMALEVCVEEAVDGERAGDDRHWYRDLADVRSDPGPQLIPQSSERMPDPSGCDRESVREESEQESNEDDVAASHRSGRGYA